VWPSHQIDRRADRPLSPAVSDIDGNNEDSGGTISVFNGLGPDIETITKPDQEVSSVQDGLPMRKSS
jgi:hypothetical protein